MKSLLACLSEHVSFKLNEQKEIASHFNKRTLKKGEYLLEAGQRCKEMAYIQSGYLRMYNTIDGNEVTLWIGGQASFITSLSSFIFESHNIWNIQAITNCEIHFIEREAHFKLLKTTPKWMEFDNILLARSFALMEQRLFAHLHTTAQIRFENLWNQDPEIFKYVPLQYIASMLGITPETLSRLRKKINKRNS